MDRLPFHLQKNWTIGNDGTISIVPLGAVMRPHLAVLDRIKLVKPEMKNMEKLNDGLMHVKDGQTVGGQLPMSAWCRGFGRQQCQCVCAMTDMIELAKNFELQTKVMKNADENSGASAKLMQLA